MVQEAYGRTVVRVMMHEGEQVIGVALCVVAALPLGRAHLFSPRGPVWAASVTDHAAALKTIVQSEVMQELIRKYRVVFWRFEPVQGSEQEWSQHATRVHDVEPMCTQVIDLAPTEDELLAAMKMRARYNVRLAEKKGVNIEWVSKSSTPDWGAYADQFWSLITETSSRHQFRAHSKAYYKTILEILGNAGVLELCIARHEGDVLSMNMMISFGDMMTYLHSGATRHKSNLKAPNLMQWECMKRAKAKGLRWYDLFGIAPEGATEHPLLGVTAFKQSLGGEPVQFSGTFELPFSSWWYSLYSIAKRLRS